MLGFLQSPQRRITMSGFYPDDWQETVNDYAHDHNLTYNEAEKELLEKGDDMLEAQYDAMVEDGL